MTDAERRLWSHLRQDQLNGLRFRRQEPVGPYVADFLCWPARLVIEVDGGQHASSNSDVTRDAYFAENAFRVLRFWNNEVLSNTEGVLAAIVAALAPSAPTQPSPKMGGR